MRLVKFYKPTKQAVSQQKRHCLSQASCESGERVKDKIFHGYDKVQQYVPLGAPGEDEILREESEGNFAQRSRYLLKFAQK